MRVLPTPRVNQLWSLLILLTSCTLTSAAAHERLPQLAEHLSRPPSPPAKDISRKFFKFVTRPDIDAPTWSVKIRNSEALDKGYWFVAPYQDLEQKKPGAAWVGPHIYDGHGELIWSGAGMFQRWNTFDFGVTTIRGEQLLTVLFPHGRVGLILDHHYQVRKQVDLDHLSFDMHAFHLIDGGSRALVVTYEELNSTEREAAEVGWHAKGGCPVFHSGFAELDVNKPSPPVFTWSSNKHIELDEVTYNDDRVAEACSNRWDILHANSIDKFVDNDYLVSARHTDTIYKISHKDGSIVWRLGGVYSDFDFVGPGNALFSRQHHAQVLGQDRSHTVVALFDNAIGTGPSEQKTNGVARGLILLLDTVEWTASILAEYTHPQGNTVSSRGSFQILPNGNAFLCWTYSSRISEHTPNGTVAMEATMGTEAHTYRAFKYPWVGRPVQPPDAVAEITFNNRGDGLTVVYVSWNGATDVKYWAVHPASPDNPAGENTTLITVFRTGFETTITYEGVLDYLVVEAFDAERKSLGRSDIVRAMPSDGIWVNPFSHPDNPLSQRRQPVTITGTSRLQNPFLAFMLGFISCMTTGSLLIAHSRRRRAMLSRQFQGRGPKFNLMVQKHVRKL